METTERIVEAYARYVKGCATLPNIRCSGQYEIDLLAINPFTLERYHIESGVSISHKFRQLTERPFSAELLKQRVQIAPQRRTMGYFVDRKFGHPSVRQTLEQYGFVEGNYTKAIVSWGWTAGAATIAEQNSVELWNFRHLMREIVEANRGTRHYFTDDTMRTLHLFNLMIQDGF